MIRRLLRFVRSAAGKPLFISQIFTSASGSIAVIFAAALMDPANFIRFSLFSLVASTLVGLVRSFLFQPALIQMRTDKQAMTPARYALPGAIFAGLILASAGLAFGATSPLSFVLLASSGIFPILQDWLRFRSMAIDRRWDVVLADAIRLATVLVSPLVLLFTRDAVAYQAYIGLSLAIPVLVIALRIPRLRTWTPLRRYLRPASLQLGDFVIGQFNSTIPLTVLGGLGSSGLIAGVRFAQTLLGPLNLVFGASTINLVADGATRDSHSRNSDLIREGKRLGRRLALLAFICVVVGVMIAWLGHLQLRGVQNEPLVIGLILVGLSTLSSGWSGIHAIVMRLMGRQAVVTIGRTVLVSITLPSFVVGYLVGGVDGSLTAGFIAAALINPVAFALPAFFVYRQMLHEDDEDDTDDEDHT